MSTVYDQYCEADRSSFTVKNRDAALGISIALLTVCFASTIVVIALYIRQWSSRKWIFDSLNQSKKKTKPRLLPRLTLQRGVSIKLERTNRNDEDVAIYCSKLCYFPSKESSRPILRDVSCELRYNSLIAVMGPSGSGKTTFIEMCTGRRDFGEYTGKVSVNGIDLENLSSKDLRNIGYMRQFENYPKHLTVSEYLFATARQLGIDKSNILECVESCTARVGMVSFLQVPISGLSGGQKRRVGVARLLLDAPRVLFLDEPTSGLDATSSLEVIQALRNLIDDGYCIVVTIHQPRMELFELFTDIFVLVSGMNALHCYPPRVPADCYRLLCERMGRKPTSKVFNPADAVIDLLEHVSGWHRLRLWFWYDVQRRSQLRLRIRHACLSSTPSTSIPLPRELDTDNVSKAKKKIAKKKRQKRKLLSLSEELNALFPTWFGNAPFPWRQPVVNGVFVTVYVVMAKYAFGACTLPYTIGFTITGFMIQNACINIASENFSTSLADMDNMLKEHVLQASRFVFFHFLIISASVFLMNIYTWIIWMPWVVDAGVNFANTINQLCAQILQGHIFAALTMVATLTLKDPSDASSVLNAQSRLTIAMAISTGFNGTTIPNQLFNKFKWFLWGSLNYPGTIMLLQNIIEGQKISCGERCGEMNANLYVTSLRMEGHDNAVTPLVVSISEAVAAWALVWFMALRRCRRTKLETRSDRPMDSVFFGRINERFSAQNLRTQFNAIRERRARLVAVIGTAIKKNFSFRRKREARKAEKMKERIAVQV
jgi:ABC-type multidrug transport system ATPase subunit